MCLFLFNNLFISDIDECKEEYPCSQLCHNTQGSYKCFCDTGYLSLDGGMTCKANSSKWDFICVYVLLFIYLFCIPFNGLKSVLKQ